MDRMSDSGSADRSSNLLGITTKKKSIMTDRSVKAEELFRQGFNCAQSVAAAFADVYGVDEKTMLRMATGFGGGIGRMRLTCGAACGMFLLAGLQDGFDDAADTDKKGDCYVTVQELAERFKAEMGALSCADLLGLQKHSPTPATPEARTEAYYKKRPCAKIVAEAAKIYQEYLDQHASSADASLHP